MLGGGIWREMREESLLRIFTWWKMGIFKICFQGLLLLWHKLPMRQCKDRRSGWQSWATLVSSLRRKDKESIHPKQPMTHRYLAKGVRITEMGRHLTYIISLSIAHELEGVLLTCPFVCTAHSVILESSIVSFVGFIHSWYMSLVEVGYQFYS